MTHTPIVLCKLYTVILNKIVLVLVSKTHTCICKCFTDTSDITIKHPLWTPATKRTSDKGTTFTFSTYLSLNSSVAHLGHTHVYLNQQSSVRQISLFYDYQIWILLALKVGPAVVRSECMFWNFNENPPFCSLFGYMLHSLYLYPLSLYPIVEGKPLLYFTSVYAHISQMKCKQ